MFDAIEQDYRRYYKTESNLWRYIYRAISNAGFRANVFYRLGVYLLHRNMSLLSGVCERLSHHLCHCWISANAEIGPGFLIAHVGGIVIGGRTRIGKNCDIRQNVTFGGNFSKVGLDGRTMPYVGDNVSVGAGAVIAGPVRIGSNSIIGAKTLE